MARFAHSVGARRDPICALATGSGRGAIAVVRASGPGSVKLARQCLPFLPETLESHRVYYGFFRDWENGEVLDEVLVGFFGEGRSFTSDETLEISCHGSPIITASVIRSLVAAGFRMAEPGEFTFRAFDSGRIDLTQVEGILDLIQARSREGARVGLRHLAGGLSKRLAGIEEGLIWVQSRLEAAIDFSHEDIIIESKDILLDRLQVAGREIEGLRGTYAAGIRLREGLRVALVGAPNVGKSSLLNLLVGEDRAIVSDRPGTTRDVVSGEMMVSGLRILVSDTAGIRETSDAIEALGIGRTMSELTKSDGVVWLVDVSDESAGLEVRDKLAQLDVPVFIGLNKSDLVSGEVANALRKDVMDWGLSPDVHLMSVKTGLGRDELTRWLVGLCGLTTVDEGSVAVNGRQYELLSKMQAQVMKAIELLKIGESEEFIAAEVSEAIFACGAILGRVHDDEVMDRVFRDFCLGK